MLINSLEQLKSLFNNCINFNDSQINSFQFDSRLVTPGDVFIALKDVRDGHDFIQSAIKNGAVACIVEKADSSLNIPQFVVDNTWQALNQIASFNRSNYNGKVIAITGSCGKTTNKEMLMHCLDNNYATQGNFNGLLGLPITMSHLNEKSDYAIFELGTDEMGNLNKLTNLAKPDIAVVTSIGPAHLEYFKSINNIIEEKLSIANGLSESGCLIIPFELAEKVKNDCRKVTVSLEDNNADSYINNINENVINAIIDKQNISFKLTDLSSHKIYNALLVLTIIKQLGLNINDYIAQIESFNAPSGRGEIVNLKNNVVLVDESYNANPLSMKKAFESFNKRPEKNKVAILGEMLELGEDEILLHKQLTNYCSNLNKVYTVGKLMQHLSLELSNKNINNQHFENSEKLIEFLNTTNFENCAILVKGSNGSKVRQAVTLLKERK